MSLEKHEIQAGEFKAKCLQLMEEVAQNRVDIIITKRGKPIARLVPYTEEQPPIHGYLKDSVQILGDITQPLDVSWEAQHG